MTRRTALAGARRGAPTLLGGLVPAAGAWAVGMDAGHGAAVGLAAAAVVGSLRSLARAAEPGWPQDPAVDAGRGWHGAALQARLLERLDVEPDRVPRLLLPRLRALLADAVARHGVDPRSAAARRLVGADLYDLLGATTWGRGRPAATDLTRRVLDRVDELVAAA